MALATAPQEDPQPDFTLAEARAAFRALEQEIGSKCQIHCSLDTNRYARAGRIDPLLSAQVYPQDVLGRTTLYAKADSWRDLLADCRRAWDAHSDTHAVNTIREMALAIISITADQGECTDAALRATFDGADVARYGQRACEQATEMASNGPFSIVTLSGANAVAA